MTENASGRNALAVSPIPCSLVKMSAFSEAALEKKLSELSNSQQSVQTLSLWLIHHRKHSKTIVNVWFNELKKGKPGTVVKIKEIVTIKLRATLAVGYMRLLSLGKASL